MDTPAGPYRIAHSILYIFVNMIPAQHETLQDMLHRIKEKDPKKKVIVISDFSFAGTLPILSGAPGIEARWRDLPRRISSLSLQHHTFLPQALALPYDASPAGLERNKEQYKYRNEELFFKEVNKHLRIIFKELGAQKEPGFPSSKCLSCGQIDSCSCGIPSLDYPHPNPPPSLRFIGGLPAGHRDAAKRSLPGGVTLQTMQERRE